MDNKNGSLKPAVFLDRDGVLTVEKSYVCSLEDLEVFSYARECVQKMKEKGYYTIVITNQSGVARGLFTEEALKEMNAYLIRKTGVDAIYYCPHYPQGSVQKYSYKCTCRKPELGMIKKSCEDFDIDMEHSYMVGDRASDILLGQRAGVKTILVESGYGTERLEADAKADYVMKNLIEVVNIL